MNVELRWHRHHGSGARQPSQTRSVPALTLWMSFSMCSALRWCRCRRSSSSESSSSILVAKMTRALRAHWSNHFSRCSKKPARTLRDKPVSQPCQQSWPGRDLSISIHKVFPSFILSSLFYLTTILYLLVWVNHHSFSQTPIEGLGWFPTVSS